MTDPQHVVVYSTALCIPCENLKRYLRDRSVEFEVRDPMMDEAAADFLESNGIRTTPVLTVGDVIVIGFDQQRVDGVLAEAGIPTQ